MEKQKKALKNLLLNYEIDGDAMQCVLQEICEVLSCFLQMVKKMKQATNSKNEFFSFLGKTSKFEKIIQTSFIEERKKEDENLKNCLQPQISAINKEEESNLIFFFTVIVFRINIL